MSPDCGVSNNHEHGGTVTGPTRSRPPGPSGPAKAHSTVASGLLGGYAMSRYFQCFKLYAEVADFLLLDRSEPVLLVDLSMEPALDRPGCNPYPHRTTFSVRDAELIARFLEEISVGDAIEAEGSFSQSDYIPHRTTCIDTTFLMADFQRLPLPEQLIPAPPEFARDALRPNRLH